MKVAAASFVLHHLHMAHKIVKLAREDPTLAATVFGVGILCSVAWSQRHKIRERLRRKPPQA